MLTVKLNFATSRPFIRYRYDWGAWQLSNKFEVEPGKGTYQFNAIDNIGCMASIIIKEEDLDFPAGDGQISLSKTITDGQAADNDVFFRFSISGPVSFTNVLVSVNNPFILKNLQMGTYTIKEEAPPSGYLNVGGSQQITLTDSNKVDSVAFNNEIDPGGVPTGPGQLTLKKVVTNPEVTFEDLVFRANVVGEFIAYGVPFTINTPAVLANIPLGAYDIEEVSLPDGFFLNTVSPSKLTLTALVPQFEVQVVNTHGEDNIGPGEITINKEVYEYV